MTTDTEKDKYVRVNAAAHRKLKIISATIGQSMVSCVGSALDDWIDRHLISPVEDGKTIDLGMGDTKDVG